MGAPAIKLVRRPNKSDMIATKFGDCTVVQVYRNGLELDIQTPVHGIERVERAPLGWWTVVKPRAWAAWHQGYFRSVRKAVQEARAWFADPDLPADHQRDRLFIVRADGRPGWRLINCGHRGPTYGDASHAFYGPITADNIAEFLASHS